MSIFGQWSNMIQMKNFKWIIGRTSKSMRRLDAACGLVFHFRLKACDSRTGATVRQGRIDELPFQEHGTGRSLYPADKVSIAVPSRSV